MGKGESIRINDLDTGFTEEHDLDDLALALWEVRDELLGEISVLKGLVAVVAIILIGIVALLMTR